MTDEQKRISKFPLNIYIRVGDKTLPITGDSKGAYPLEQARVKDFIDKTGSLWIGGLQIAKVRILRGETSSSVLVKISREKKAYTFSELFSIVKKTKMKVQAVIGRTMITPEEALALKPGSLIPLHDSQLGKAKLFMPELRLDLAEGEVISLSGRMGLKVEYADQQLSKKITAFGDEISCYAHIGEVELSVEALTKLEENDIVRLNTLEPLNTVTLVIGESVELPAFYEVRNGLFYVSVLPKDEFSGLYQKAFDLQNDSSSITKQINSQVCAQFEQYSAENAGAIVEQEHPQIAAFLLSSIPPEEAAKALVNLPEERRTSLIKRMSGLKSCKISAELQSLLCGILNKEYEVAAGVPVASGLSRIKEIFGNLSTEDENTLLTQLQDQYPKITAKIRDTLITFEDLFTYPDLSIQKILREIDSRELAIAFKGIPKDFYNRVLQNMSKKGAQILQDEITYLGPLREKDVQTARNRIRNVIGRLAAAGEIVTVNQKDAVQD